jgi:phage-related protein
MNKKIVWDRVALETLRSCSVEVRREVGTLLRLLQQGYRLGMPQSKPLRNLGPSAFELRIGDRSGIYRVFYVLAAKDLILVPHVFAKKTQKTSLQEFKIAKIRLRRLINEIK